MGKLLITLGVLTILFVVILVMAAILPPEWVGYVLSKTISLFTGEGQHIYFKVVPSTNSYGYLYGIAIGIVGVTLVYYGNKLNGSASK